MQINVDENLYFFIAKLVQNDIIYIKILSIDIRLVEFYTSKSKRNLE